MDKLSRWDLGLLQGSRGKEVHQESRDLPHPYSPDAAWGE